MDTHLLSRVGLLDQVAGIRHYRQADGSGAGASLFTMHNLAGLRFSLVADKCLDLLEFEYRGVNFAFQSKNGLVHPHKVGPLADDFYTAWGGGMLATCGLSNVGDAVELDGLHPIHGRIGATPARLLQADERWEGDDLVLEVRAEMSETRLYSRNLRLRRCVSTSLHSKTVQILDDVTNFSATEEPVFLLYHINLGYPFLDQDTLVGWNAEVDEADVPARMGPPTSGVPMATTLHRGGSAEAAAVLINERLGLGLGIEWDRERLPYMHQWRNQAPGEYVLAIEPATCSLAGRAAALQAGEVPLLPGYGTARFGVTLTVLDGTDEVADFVNRTGARPRVEREVTHV